MGLIVGLGPGLFSLVLLWFVVMLICLVFMQARRTVALTAVAAATLFTLLLTSIPIKTPSEANLDDSDRVLDPLYVWRLTLVALMTLTAAGGGATVVLLHYNERVLAKPLRRFGPP